MSKIKLKIWLSKSNLEYLIHLTHQAVPQFLMLKEHLVHLGGSGADVPQVVFPSINIAGAAITIHHY